MVHKMLRLQIQVIYTQNQTKKNAKLPHNNSLNAAMHQKNQYDHAYDDLSSNTTRPGSALPSSSSSEAPPPVDTCDIRTSCPDNSAALAESPPPMILNKPVFSVASAIASATLKVPAAYVSISNTPMGPFQMAVLHP
mmetsp:Transcript_28805/g.42317  ORF Transcript_28805/g.42317 Transcript_28805/m.42317 type:complete len:137 (+) Transcript_28805:152-562(+)